MDIVGKIVSGDFSGIIIRQKTGIDVELGELLVTRECNDYFICKFLMFLMVSIPERIRSLAAFKVRKKSQIYHFLEIFLILSSLF